VYAYRTITPICLLNPRPTLRQFARLEHPGASGLRRLSPPRGAGWEPADTLRGICRAKKSHLVGAVAAGTRVLAGLGGIENGNRLSTASSTEGYTQGIAGCWKR
jgi:hypothetical protein